MEKRIKIMLQLQEAMNIKVDPEWRLAHNEWYRAVWVECGEMMEHTGYKWWKKQEIDIAQVHLEIVDVCHFMLSIALLNAKYDPEWIALQFKQNCLKSATFKESIDALAFKQLESENIRPMFNLLAEVMSYANMDFNELFMQYCAKNVLNIFRQDNGYKEGTYTKEWLVNGKYVEDNEALSELLFAYTGLEDDFMVAIRSDLDAIYSSI